MWIDAMKHMMSGEWKKASDLLRRASTKHDGWGWAVNHGDLWYTESLALLMDGAEKSLAEEGGAQDNAWLTEVTALLEKGASRANAGNAFGPDGHPWVSEISLGGLPVSPQTETACRTRPRPSGPTHRISQQGTQGRR